MNVEAIKNNKVKMILQFSIPAIVAMVLTSLITIVDGFFIGNYVGAEGVAAVNLGLPIVYLYLAVGLMIGVGGVAIAGIAFGEGNIKKCNHVFNQTIWTTIVAVSVLSVLVGLCLTPLLKLLNADIQVADYFKTYYTIMLLELPVMIINTSFGMFIRSEGKPIYFMNINILNVAMNILLDYLFVKWFGLGVFGVAVASLIAAVVCLVCILHFFIRQAKVYKLNRFTFCKDVLKSTILNGSSEFIGEISLSISMFAYNLVIMKQIGIDGVTAFTIVGYIAYLFSMIIIGFGQGISPLISFIYGAKVYDVAQTLRKITNIFVVGVGIGVLLMVYTGAEWYSSIFINNESVEQMIQSGIGIFAVSFLFSGVNTITSFYFTSIGKAKESAIVSASRGLFILLICIATLPILLGMMGVWLVAPITEAITLFISIYFIQREKNNWISLKI